MPAVETFCFDGYTLRPADGGDLRLATEWTQADPHHRSTTDPVFWLEQTQKSDSYMLEDDAGPIFYFKMMRTADAHIVELHIQFPPPKNNQHEQSVQIHRQMAALILGFAWVERVLLFSGVTEVFFRSESPALISFCVKRLGFQKKVTYKDTYLTKRIAVQGKGNGVCAEPVHSRHS